MELIYDIPLKTLNIDNIKRTHVERAHIKLTIDNFNKLNLMESINTLSYDDFINKIKIHSVLLTVYEFLQNYFNNIDMNMSHDILMAYCISSYANKMFSTYKSRFEQKLIIAGNTVVVDIERLIKQESRRKKSIDHTFMKEFYEAIDHYCSLFKIWHSKDILNKQNEIFDELCDIIKIYKIQIKKGISINYNVYDQSLICIDKMFQYNHNFAIQTLLHNYNIFNMDNVSDVNTNNIKEIIWTKTSDELLTNFNGIFIILVVELRIKLIPLLQTPTDRKDLYYNIDIENIVENVRNCNFDHTKINNILSLLQLKVKIINDDYKIGKIITTNNKQMCRSTVKLFKNMYNMV